MERTASLSRAQVNCSSPGSSGRRQAQSSTPISAFRGGLLPPDPSPTLIWPAAAARLPLVLHGWISRTARAISARSAPGIPGHRRHHLAAMGPRPLPADRRRRGQPAPWGLVPQGSSVGWGLAKESRVDPELFHRRPHTPLASKRTHGAMKPLGGVQVHTPKNTARKNEWEDAG